jgi:hypothetical protein
MYALKKEEISRKRKERRALKKALALKMTSLAD